MRIQGSDSLSGPWWVQEADPEKEEARASKKPRPGLDRVTIAETKGFFGLREAGPHVSLGSGQDGDDSAQKTQG